MKTLFKQLQDAIKECNVPYVPGSTDEVYDVLLTWFKEQNITPFEYVIYIFRKKGPAKVVKNLMCSYGIMTEYLIYKDIRTDENKLKIQLEKDRLKNALNSRQNLEELLTSVNETYMVLFKYLLAKSAGYQDLVELFEPGARYELRSMPELRAMFAEFGERLFPQEESE